MPRNCSIHSRAFLLSSRARNPFVTFSDLSWPEECVSVWQGCNVAHVLGLYKMSGARGAAFSLTYRGALADMMLWAIFRLQTRVFSSNTYDR